MQPTDKTLITVLLEYTLLKIASQELLSAANWQIIYEICIQW